MKKFLAAVTLLLAFGVPAFAHEFEKGDIVVEHPWTRATAPGAAVGVGYMSITNKGKEADTLTGGSFTGATNVEVHEMKMDDGKMTMRELKDGLEIKPGETVKLEPNGYHLMFKGLKDPIAKGEDVKGSLTFKKAGTIDVGFSVESIGAMGDSDHDKMKMDGMSHDPAQ